MLSPGGASFSSRGGSPPGCSPPLPGVWGGGGIFWEGQQRQMCISGAPCVYVCVHQGIHSTEAQPARFNIPAILLSCKTMSSPPPLSRKRHCLVSGGGKGTITFRFPNFFRRLDIEVLLCVC